MKTMCMKQRGKQEGLLMLPLLQNITTEERTRGALKSNFNTARSYFLGRLRKHVLHFQIQEARNYDKVQRKGAAVDQEVS